MLYSDTENKSKKRRMSWMDLHPSLPKLKNDSEGSQFMNTLMGFTRALSMTIILNFSIYY